MPRDRLAQVREGRWNGHVARLPVIVAHMVRGRAVDRLRRLQSSTEPEAEFGRVMLETSHHWMAPDGLMEDKRRGIAAPQWSRHELKDVTATVDDVAVSVAHI
jgi:hypothetical protein